MFTLYYNSLCPRSRSVRAYLTEVELEYKIKQVNFWEIDSGLEILNPSMELPVLQTETDRYICGIYPIVEYINDIAEFTSIKADFSANYKAEVRRLTSWAHEKFNREITNYIVNEKPLSFYLKVNQINQNALKVARVNLDYHLTYITFLLKDNRYLAGEYLSFADFAMAAELSILDYFAEVNWADYEYVKEWYLLIKSRPSFRQIFAEKIPGFRASNVYMLLDF